MGFAAIARVTEDRWIACAVRDEIAFGLLPGGELKIETTICNEIRQHQSAVIIDHVAESEAFATHHTPAMYGFQSYISVPIILKDGSFFGTLCAIDPQPNDLENQRVRGMFTAFAELISFHVGAARQLNTTELTLDAQRRSIDVVHRLNVELEQARKKLMQALETGKMGTWTIDPATQHVSMSAFIRELFGFSLEDEIPMEQIMAAIDPSYHDMLTNALHNALEHHYYSDTEYPITNLQTGEKKWVRATGQVFVDENGKALEYSGMLTDITENKLDELRKNDFIAMVSHELKTPLTSISGYLQMLRMKAKKSDDAFTTTSLEKAGLQVKKMTSMINGFLNVSRLNSGKIQLNTQKFRLNELILEIVGEMSLLSSAHHIGLSPCDSVVVVADRNKIGNVISNLLSNAVKYSPPQGSIDIRCQISGSEVTVSITDEGMGIREEDISKLFTRFYRVGGTETQNISGFGIGLYLCEEIVHSHGGKIWVESEVGKGSSFFFTLPHFL